MVGKTVTMFSVILACQLIKLKNLPYTLLINSVLSNDYQVPSFHTPTTPSKVEQITNGMTLGST